MPGYTTDKKHDIRCSFKVFQTIDRPSVDNDKILIEINYVNELKTIMCNILTVTLNNYHKE